MIQPGKKSKIKYWGKFTVKKVSKLKYPVKCYSEEVGEVEFNPTIVKIEWEKEPSEDKHDLWFPYWISINGKEKYGQFAPMIGQKALLELMENAIDDGFFDIDFLKGLNTKIDIHLKTILK